MAEKSKSETVKVFLMHHGSRGVRIVYDARHRPVALKPGEVTKDLVEMHASQVELLKQQNGDIRPVSGRQMVADENKPKVDEAEEAQRKEAAKALADKAQNMDLDEFRSQAKLLLGDAWPASDKTSKAEIIARLKAV